MSDQIAVVAGRHRRLADQKLPILREAFGSDGLVGATCKRSRSALQLAPTRAHAGALDEMKRTPPPPLGEVDTFVSSAAMVGNWAVR